MVSFILNVGKVIKLHFDRKFKDRNLEKDGVVSKLLTIIMLFVTINCYAKEASTTPQAVARCLDSDTIDPFECLLNLAKERDVNA